MAGLVIVAGVLLVALLAPWLAPHDPTKPDFMAILQAPDGKYLLGTDEVGRDLLSRLIYGARASIRAGLIAVAIAIAIGVPIGLLSGYLRGWVDQLVFMRLTDAMIAFPTIVLALALAAALGGNLTTAMLAIGIGSAPAFISGGPQNLDRPLRWEAVRFPIGVNHEEEASESLAGVQG